MKNTTVYQNELQSDPFYSATIDRCDRLIDAFLKENPPSGDDELKADTRPLQEDMEDINWAAIHAKGGLIRIWVADNQEFKPCDYFGVSIATWLTEYDNASLARRRARVSPRNIATTAENKRRREWNHQTREDFSFLPPKELNAMLLSVLPVAEPLDLKSSEVFVREQQVADLLDMRKPMEWSRLVNAISMPLRAHIGRIVWWDYFSDRPYQKRWNDLDDYLSCHVKDKHRRRDVFHALIACGYTPHMARERSAEPKNHQDYK